MKFTEFPKIEEDNMDDIWFQQDGATCHTGYVTIDLLRGAVIWRHWTIFCEGAIEDKCYANHPETIEALKHEIEVAIHGIEAQTKENVFKNWVDRMGYCKARRGIHLDDVFHT